MDNRDEGSFAEARGTLERKPREGKRAVRETRAKGHVTLTHTHTHAYGKYTVTGTRGHGGRTCTRGTRYTRKNTHAKHTPQCVTSIALTNANNCQNQGKGCSTPTPTRLVDILQRAFEEKVKNQEQLSVDQTSKQKYDLRPRSQEPFHFSSRHCVFLFIAFSSFHLRISRTPWPR